MDYHMNTPKVKELIRALTDDGWLAAPLIMKTVKSVTGFTR